MIIVVLFVGLVIVTILLWFDSKNRVIPKQLSMIKRAIKKKDFETAHSLLNNLPEDKKKDKDIIFLHYDLYKSEKQYFLAIYELEKILNLKENSLSEEIDCRLKKAELFNLLGKPKSSYQEYESILELDSNNFEANFSIGKYLFELNYFSTAKNYLNKALENKKDDIEVKEMLLNILIEEEKYVEAKEQIKKLIESIEKQEGIIFCRIQYSFALIEYYLGNLREALAIIEKIHPSYQKNQELNLLKGLCLYELKMKDQGEEIFSTILSKNIDNYSKIHLLARYKYAEKLFYEKKIFRAKQQTLFIDGYKQPYKDNDDRKFIFDNLDTIGLVESFFIREITQLKSKDFMFKTNPHSFEKTYLFNEFTFCHVYKNKDWFEVLFFSIDIVALEENSFLNFIEKVANPYMKKLSYFYFYTFLPISFDMKEKFNKATNVRIINEHRFFDYLKKTFHP